MIYIKTLFAHCLRCFYERCDNIATENDTRDLQFNYFPYPLFVYLVGYNTSEIKSNRDFTSDPSPTQYTNLKHMLKRSHMFRFLTDDINYNKHN